MTTANDSNLPDFADELLTAFRWYCADGTVSAVSPKAMGDVRHCLGKAMRNAAILGEEVDIYHHQAFVVWALETGQPERIPEFLMALRRDELSRIDPED
jgi:hypothetical protein